MNAQGEGVMDHIPTRSDLPPSPVDEAALAAFIDSPGFDAFLLDCFEQGIREAVAADQALGIRPTTAA
jgi:hypothetical protein